MTRNISLLIVLFFLISCQIEEKSISTEIANKKEKTKEITKKFTSPSVPKKIDFCGNEFPMDQQIVQEQFDLEFVKNIYWHSNVILMLKRANRYFPLIESILKKEGIPDDFKYLALAESGLNPTISSPAKAKGTWQFLTETAKNYGLEVSKYVDERMNVEKATYAACKYLKGAHDKFGSWTLAAASYNMGIGGLNKAIEAQHSNDYFFMNLNPETNRYLFRIATLKHLITHPKEYGFDLKETDLYKPFDTKLIKITETIENLPVWARKNNITYRELKFYNPWLTSIKLKVNNGKSYNIQIPNK